jgi:hypothetical protein
MARGSKIHPDVHYIVIRLSSIMKPRDIAIYTGISQQSVVHIYFGTLQEEFVTNERYTVLTGKMAYNAYGILPSDGRDDKVRSVRNLRIFHLLHRLHNFVLMHARNDDRITV